MSGDGWGLSSQFNVQSDVYLTQGSVENCCHFLFKLAEHQSVKGWLAESFGGGNSTHVDSRSQQKWGEGGGASWLWVQTSSEGGERVCVAELRIFKKI